MLTKLEIENFIFVKHTEIVFSKGLNVFSGETGAGKSMIFRALSIALGEKAHGTMVHRDCKFLRVVLSFGELKHSEILRRLIAMGVDLPTKSRQAFEGKEQSDGENFLKIERIVSAEGKSKVRINATPVSIAELRELAPFLLDIHSQHQQQYLLDPSTHLLYYDAFVGLKALRQEYEKSYQRWKKNKVELTAHREEVAKAAAEQDFLKFQQAELQEGSMSASDYADLKKQLKDLSEREAKSALFLKSSQLLRAGVLESMGSVRALLQSQLGKASEDEQEFAELEKLKEQVDTLNFSLQDIHAKFEAKTERIDFLTKIDRINSKLAKVEALLRKYGLGIDELWEKYNKIEEKLSRLENVDEQEKQLLSKMRVAERDAIKQALTLHVRRKEGIANFQSRVKEEISFLGMEASALVVSLFPEKIKFDSDDVVDTAIESTGYDENQMGEMLSIYGLSKLEFLYSAARGVPAERLKKIISGGELSRLMLALKILLNEKIPVQTMIFDEIDTGIGGDTATNVGQKLKQLATKKQVIVITHLAQIARYAEAHFSVDRPSKKKNEVVVWRLKNSQLSAEISRMLGGKDLDAAKKLADEMLGEGI